MNIKFPIIAHAEMALSFALSFAVLLSAVLPVQSSYCASTCAVHVTQPILFFVANAPNHIPGLSRKPMVDPHMSKLVYLLPVCDTCQQCLRRRYQSWTTQIPMQHMQKSCPLDYSWSVLRYMRPMVLQGVHGHEHNVMYLRKSCIKQRLMAMLPLRHAQLLFIILCLYHIGTH